jgi:hypothetical protein
MGAVGERLDDLAWFIIFPPVVEGAKTSVDGQDAEILLSSQLIHDDFRRSPTFDVSFSSSVRESSLPKPRTKSSQRSERAFIA